MGIISFNKNLFTSPTTLLHPVQASQALRRKEKGKWRCSHTHPFRDLESMPAFRAASTEGAPDLLSTVSDTQGGCFSAAGQPQGQRQVCGVGAMPLCTAQAQDSHTRAGTSPLPEVGLTELRCTPSSPVRDGQVVVMASWPINLLSLVMLQGERVGWG